MNTKPYIVITDEDDETDVEKLMLDTGDELGYNATPYTTYGEDFTNGFGEVYSEGGIFDDR